MKRINIVNEGEKFNKKKYEGALGDYDKDGLANIDDANPYTSEKNPQKVEQIELSKTFEKLLTLKNQLDDTMDVTIGELDTIAPKGSLIYARTKTPYSILKKLVEKRLTDKQRGLTDLVGTTIVVDDLKDLRKVDKAIKKGEIGKVVEREDMYKNPKGGYRAIHYLVEVDGYIVEVQLKTKRQKAINEQSHEAYKKGTLNSEYLLYVTDLANKADKGNRKAYIEFDRIIDNPTQLAKDLDTSFEFGGEITRSYDVNVKSGVGTYAKGGEVEYEDIRVRRLWNERGYDGNYLGSLSERELQKLYDTEFYFEENEFEYAKGGELMDADTQVDYAKGGEVATQTITIKFKNNSDALSGKQLLEDYYIDFGEIDNYGDELDLVATNPSFQYLEYIRAALKGTQEKIEISSYANGGSVSFADFNPAYPFAKGGRITIPTENRKIKRISISEISAYISFADGERIQIMPLTRRDEYGDSYPILQATSIEGEEYNRLLAKGGWIQDATAEMEKKGTIGSFTAKAKRYGLTPQEFAKKVLADDGKTNYTLKTKRQAQFMKNANPEMFSDGGEINRSYDVNINSGVGTYATGGVTEAGDVDFPSQMLNYAKGGVTKKEAVMELHRSVMKLEKLREKLAPIYNTDYILEIKKAIDNLSYAYNDFYQFKSLRYAEGGNIMQDISLNANTGDGNIMPDASSMVGYAKGGKVTRVEIQPIIIYKDANTTNKIYRGRVEGKKEWEKEDKSSDKLRAYFMDKYGGIITLFQPTEDLSTFKEDFEYAKGGYVKNQILSFSFNANNTSLDEIIEIVEKYSKNWRTSGGTMDDVGVHATLKPSQVDDLESDLKSVDVFNLRRMESRYAKGGKTQGYNARLDESLAERDGAERSFEQKKKDRRDESKAMEKAKGKRAYASVKSMDKNDRFNFSFTDDFFKDMSSAPKPMKRKKRKK